VASRAETGERYATQVGALWTRLAQTLARLEALAAEAAVPLCRVGSVGGREVSLGGAAVALNRLAEAHGQGLANLLD
jgi:hypothetical protein